MESTNFCPECGHKARAAARFCAKCGQELATPQAASQASLGIQDEPGLAGRGAFSWSARLLLAGMFSLVLVGAGTYLGFQFLTAKVGRFSPSETVRAMVVAANDRQAGAFQQQLSQWFRGEVEREVLQTGRPVEDLLAVAFTRSGSIAQIDILAERICAQEASVYFRLRSLNGESRPSYAHLVTENGIWKINGLENVRSTCTVADNALTGQPLHTWALHEPLDAVSAQADVETSSTPTAIPGQLTRPVAAKLIQQNSSFATANALALCADAREGGISEGLWVRQGFDQLALTASGSQYLAAIEGGFTGYAARPVVPAKREVVAVTGIAVSGPAENINRADFTWRYTGLSEIVARHACQGNAPHEGEAYLQLYDDGWRVERITSLNETGRVAFSIDPVLVERVQEAAHERQQQEQAAKASTRVLAEYVFDPPDGGFAGEKLIVTDTNITLVYRGRKTETIGYWELQGASSGGGGRRIHFNGGGRSGSVIFSIRREDEARFQEAVAQSMRARDEWQSRYPYR